MHFDRLCLLVQANALAPGAVSVRKRRPVCANGSWLGGRFGCGACEVMRLYGEEALRAVMAQVAGACLIVTHDEAQAGRLAQRTLLMQGGLLGALHV